VSLITGAAGGRPTGEIFLSVIRIGGVAKFISQAGKREGKHWKNGTTTLKRAGTKD
jgi:hypothetical protein